MRLRRVHQHGFRLLEGLVEVAVFAVAMGALDKAACHSADNIAYIRDQTIAGWVASNKINELMLVPGWPASSERTGVAEMAGRQWYWRLRVAPTDDRDIRRLDVAVAANEQFEPVLTELAAFKNRL